LDQENESQRYEEELEKLDVERRTESNKFLEQILGGMNNGINQQEGQNTPLQQAM
jgi:hypothetical protein